MIKSKGQIFVVAGAVITFAMYFVYCLCVDTVVSSDDLTLFNPVYNYLHTGKLAYPVYGMPDIIIVHPPVHYFTVSVALKCGLNVQQAYALPFLAALFFLLTTVCVGKFSFHQKVAALLSLQCLYMFPLASVRPDCTLALLWFASLLWFLWAEKTNFSIRILFVVGLVTAYGSTLHYYAAFSNLTFFVYAFRIISNRQRSEALRKILALAAGFATVLLPYYFLFVVPHLQQIFVQIDLNQGIEVSSLQRHWDYYDQFAGFFEKNYFFSPVIMLLYGSFLFHVPIVGFLLLLILIGKYRQMVLSAFPMLLVILLVSRSKSEGYFMPEYMLFTYMVAMLLMSKASGNRTVRYVLYIWMAGAGLLTGGTVLGQALGDFSLKNNPMQGIRAAVQKNLAGKTFVAGVISGWYIGGATTWRDISMEMNTARLPSRDSLIKFFSRFDAVVQTKHMADFSGNEARKGIHTLYLDSLLHLKSFVFSDNGGYSSELACLLFSARKPQLVIGVLSRQGKPSDIVKQDSTGNLVFVSFQAPNKPWMFDSLKLNEEKLIGLNYFLLPDEQTTVYDYRSRQTEECLALMLLKKEDFYLIAQRLKQHTKIRDVVFCRLHRETIPEDKPVEKYLLPGK